MCVQVPTRTRRGIRLPGAEVTENCELPGMGAGKPTSSALEEQQALFTTKSSL